MNKTQMSTGDVIQEEQPDVQTVVVRRDDPGLVTACIVRPTASLRYQVVAPCPPRWDPGSLAGRGRMAGKIGSRPHIAGDDQGPHSR